MNYEEIYQNFIQRKGVTSSNMFGAKGLFINGNCFMANMKNGMLFRLDERGQKLAMKVDGAKYFDPKKTGKGMKSWIEIPFDRVNKTCEKVAEFALEYVTQLPPKVKTKK